MTNLNSGGPEAATAALTAAQAAISRLPLADPLDTADPIMGRGPALPADAAMAVRATMTGAVNGELIFIVNAEMLEVLQSGPMEGLAPAGLLQPSLTAAAEALGAIAGTATEISLTQLNASSPRLIAVPMLDEGNQVATLVLNSNAAADVMAPAQGMNAGAAPGTRGLNGGIDLLGDVEMEVIVEIGRTRLTVRELLSLMPGQVIELDRAAGSPADLYVHGTLLARGEIVVVDEDFGIRITEIVKGGLEAQAGAVR